MESHSESDPLLETHVDLMNSDSEFIQVNHIWQVFSATMHTIVHTLLGGSVFMTLWYTWSLDVGSYQLHIILCVIGYQLLMSHGMLVLSGGTWNGVPRKCKRRLHWILQLVGAALSIAGSFVMGFNFKSLHGKFGLAALIFSCVSLINGVTSLYAVELRHFIPAKVSKMSHVIFGTAAFVLSSVCLALGYNKSLFKTVTSTGFAYVMIGIVCVYTVFVVTAPCYKLLKSIF